MGASLLLVTRPEAFRAEREVLAVNPLEEVHRAVADVAGDSHLLPYDAFVAWFAEAQIVDTREEAVNGLTNAAEDKGIDAAYLDPKRQRVTLVQGKYHEKRGQDNRAAQDFAEQCVTFTDPSSQARWEMAGSKSLGPLLAAWEAVHRKGFALVGHFASTGTVSEDATRQAVRTARSARKRGLAAFDVFDRQRLLVVVEDWLADVKPIPEFEIPVAGGQAFQHKDPDCGTAWVLTVTGDVLRQLYREHGDRLFARNVRGYLGDNQVNRAIAGTARDRPPWFWYVNNGVTIVADRAQAARRKTGTVYSVRVLSPQVVNGQQTIRELAKSKASLDRVQTLVRVIALPTGGAHHATPEGPLAMLVRGTNWQSRVTPSDLMANHPEQVRLQRELRKRKYYYIRKHTSRKEITASAAFGFVARIDRQWLASALAATHEDCYHLIREDELWEGRNHKRLFVPGRHVDDYLARHHLAEWVQWFGGAFDRDKQQPAHWAVTWVLWHKTSLGGALSQKLVRMAFIDLSERWKEKGARATWALLESAARPLFVLARAVYADEVRTFRAEQRGKEPSRRRTTPPSADSVFRRAEAPILLAKALRRDPDKRTRVRDSIRRFIKALEAG